MFKKLIPNGIFKEKDNISSFFSVIPDVKQVDFKETKIESEIIKSTASQVGCNHG